MRSSFPLIVAFLLAVQGCELGDLPPAAEPPQQPQPQQQQPQQQPPQVPQQQPAPAQGATKVSVFDKAVFTDLGVGPDGTRHALYQENDLNLGREQVYYRASTDGGQTWSEAVNLSEFDPAHRAGFIRLAIDGDGRVYAFWKATTEWYDNPGGSVYSGTLVYRTLERGAWSRAVEVSAPNGTYSWFPSVDPNGQLHVVWNEILPNDQIFQLARDAGLVLQATVTGTAVGPRREVYRAAITALPGPDGNGAGQAIEGLTGLKGYVDADGVAHWVAEKYDAERDTQVVVHWDGRQETPLFDQSAFTHHENFTEDPPQLVVDDRGNEHVLLRDSREETQTILDYPLPAGNPVVVRQGIDFKGFNVVQGANGAVAVLFSVKDTYGSDSRYDLFASSFRDGAWTPSANLTSNLAQDDLQSGQAERAGSYYTHEFHDAGFAAGAFDAAGRLNLLYIDAAATQTDIFGNLGTKLGPVGRTYEPAAFFRVM